MLGWTPAGCCALQQQARARPPARPFSWRMGSGKSPRLRLGAALKPLCCQNASTENRNTSGAAGWTRPPADTVLCSSANASPPPPQQGRGEKLAASTRVTYREPIAPGAAPAGSSAGTGSCGCQQQAPVVSRFVLRSSLVLGLSPRTRLGCSDRFSRCFLGLGSGRFTTCCCWGCILIGHTPPSHPESEGKEEEPELSGTAACLTAPRATETFFGCWHLPASPRSQPLPALHQRAGFAHPQPHSQTLLSPSSRTFSSPTHGAG